MQKSTVSAQHTKDTMHTKSTPKKKEISRKEIMLSLVEVLYNSSSINDATYAEVKRAINREVSA